MGFLEGLQTKAKAKPQDVVARAFGNGTYSFSNAVSPYRDNWDLDRAIATGLERDIWVYKCVDTIASSQSNIPIDIKKYNRTNDGEVIEDSKLHNLLNRRPNPYEDSQSFRYRLGTQALLSKNGAFIEVQRNPQGEPQAMYLLDPSTVTPRPHPTKFVDAFVVDRADGKIDELAPENVIWVKLKPHPTDPYRQLTPLGAAGISVETDYLARLFNRNFLKNDGRPGLLVTIDGEIQSEDAAEINNRFAGGASTAGKTMVLEARGLKVVDMSSKPRDVQWQEATAGAKEDILVAFGVPESMLGNTEGRCLRQTELVHLADGSVVQARDLVGTTFKLLQPRKDGIVEVTADASWNGKEKIYKITTFSGRTLETNGNHPLFMAEVADNIRFKARVQPHGWTKMAEIKEHFERLDARESGVYTEVAVPYMFPHESSVSVDQDLAYSLGVDMVEISDDLLAADNETQKVFLSALFNVHGAMSQHSGFSVAPPTYEYGKRLQTLLLRVGVYSTLTTQKNKHLLVVGTKLNMLNLLDMLDLNGDAAEKSARVRKRLDTVTMAGPVMALTSELPPGLMWDRVYSVEEIGEDETVAITVPDGNTYLSGFWEHNTYNNAETELEFFWSTTMVTHCDAIARNLDALTGVLGDEVYLAYDYSVVDVLQRAKRRKLDKVAQDFARGAINLDEYRIQSGMRPLNVVGSRIYINARGMIFAEDDADIEAARLLPVVGQGTGQRAGDSTINPFTAGGDSAIGDGQIGGQNDMLQTGNAFSGSDDATMTIDQVAARANRTADRLGSTVESVSPVASAEVMDRVDTLRNKALAVSEHSTKTTRLQMSTAVLDTLTERQMQIVSERLDHAKARKGTRHWEGEGKGDALLDTAYIVQNDWLEDPYLNYVSKVLGIDIDKVKAEEGKVLDATREMIAEADRAGLSISAIKTMLAEAARDVSMERRTRIGRHVQ